MKIIDVAEHYSEQGGGVKTYINEKLKSANRLGHEMIIIAPGPKDRVEEKNGGRIIWQKNPLLIVDKRYGVFRNIKAVHEVLDQEQPDIVEGSSIWRGGRIVNKWEGRALKLFIFHQDAIAAYAHTYLDRYMTRDRIDGLFHPMWSYIRSVSQGYDHTIVSGDWLGRRLQKFKIKDPLTVPFGIDKSFFSPDKRSMQVKRDLLSSCGRGGDVPLLLVASRFHPEKRLRTLFRSVGKLNKSSPVAMIVYGEGVLSAADRQYAAKTPGIRLAGFTKDREELATAYASADVMVHGSAAETFGLGVAEALCSGLPVVAPSVGGAADLVKDNYGVLYKPGDVNGCAAAINKALNIDRSDWDNRLRSVDDSIYSVEEHFEVLFTLYEQKLFEKRKLLTVLKMDS